MICPKCKSDRGHRSHRQGVKEYVGGLFQYYPYRCRGCGHRFFVSSSETAEEPTATETEIRATRSKYQRKQHRREFLLYGSALLIYVGFLYYITRYHGGSSNGE
jgi:hypothetical protein